MATTWYDTGTASVANGDTTITFADAIVGSEDDPNFQIGDLFMDPAQPEIPPQRIASVDYDAETVELAVAWPGTTMVSAAYELRYVGKIERSTAQTRRYLEALGKLGATALAGIVAAIVPTLTERADYDNDPVNTVVIVCNVSGSGRAAYYQLLVPGGVPTWSNPAYLTGPSGADGATVSEVLTALGVHGITVSTSAPTGGVDGDLWFRVGA